MTTIKLLKEPYIPKGYEHWKVSYHDGKTSFDPLELALHLEPEQEKGYIKGDVLAKRMKGKGLNANVLQYLLEHPDLIPEEWKEKWVYFWGTILRRPSGSLYVRCLYWYDDRWFSVYDRLDYGWDSYYPAAVSASSKKSDPMPSRDALSLALGYLDAAEVSIEEARKLLLNK